MTATPALAATLAPGPRDLPGRALAAVILANVLLAFGPWMVRLADVGPVASGFWRVAIAAPLLFIATRATRQPVPRLAPSAWLALGVAGVAFALDLAVWHIGLLRTQLANATLFGNITSFFFAAYGFLVARTLPGRRQTAALALAVAGVLLLVGRSYELSAAHFTGDLLCILAGVFYTAYLIAIDRFRATLQPCPMLLIATLFAILTLGPIAWASGETLMPHRWGPLVLMAIGSQVAGQGLMVYALGQLPPVMIGLSLLLQPVINAAIGWIGYGERLTALDFVGAAAIGAALVLVRDRR